MFSRVRGVRSSSSLGESVDFVEHHNHLLVAVLAAYLGECLVHDVDLLLKLRMAYVDYMDEYVGVTHLVEGRLEGVDKMGGKLADESYGVGEQEGEIVDDDLAHGGVESGKKLVLV